VQTAANPSHAAPPAPRRWRPSPLILASFGLHAVCLALLFVQPQWWPGLAITVIANHLALALIGLWPRSRLLGPNLLRLPEAAAQRGEVALTFDDGPDANVTPQVLDLLDRHGAKASFFCIGEKAAAHPELVREIVRRGHSVENHSQRHPAVFGFLGPRALHAEISAAQRAIAAAAGEPPLYFRSPMGIRSPLLDPVMARLGLTYITWTRRGFDTVARDPAAVLARLERGLSAGDVLLLHDRQRAHGQPLVLQVLPGLLERIAAARLKPVSLRAAMQ
jgi:peptidoglycan/xylan/chitin deacetylase (PgdA/CDA1 family)